MSNDLISRSALIEKIKEWQKEHEPYDEPTDVEGVEDNAIYMTLEGVQALLEEQPTAYNVDEVLEQLEELAQIEYDREDECDEEGYGDAEQLYDDGISQGKYGAYRRTIEIVKGGGVNE